jgi:hypothetical protein
MQDSLSLSTAPLPHPAMDYARLRAEGIKLLERLAGRQWTDFNTQDPGITILEQFCYALTDLGYRINYPMADLLAGSAEPGLPGPAEILTADPVTHADLRALALDIAGIANAWVEEAPRESALAFYHHPGSGELRFGTDAAVADGQPIRLRGLHRVLLRSTEQVSGDAALAAVATRLHRHRLLGEDLEFSLLGDHVIRLEASIEVGPVEAPADLLADILERIDAYLAPSARFVTLTDALASGRGLDELFEGPRLARGVVDELPPPRRQVYVSDLIHAVMDAPQVRAVRSIKLGSSETPQWSLAIPAGHIAKLASLGKLASDSKIGLLRDGLPLAVDLTEVRARLEQRRLERARAATDPGYGFEPPVGRDRGLARYHSIQRQLPAAYGVGLLGLPASAPARRRAQARQLEAYLLIFDQLLANGFAQLAQAHELLSPGAGTRTYFAQPVDDPPLSFDELLTEPRASFGGWLDREIEPVDPLERRKRFLAHLLARFGEQLGDDNWPQDRDDGDPTQDTDAPIIARRGAFLRDYPRLSGARGSGQDLLGQVSLPSGFEQRLRLKLGLPEKQRFYVVEHILLRPLPEDSGQLVEEGEEQVPLLAGVEVADPWSLQVSFVFEDPQNTDLEQRVARTILDETPAHLTAHLHWFSVGPRGDEDKQDWAAFESAWAEFREHYRAYRLPTGQAGRDADAIQRSARDARDRVIDLLGLGRTYPLRDLPFPEQLFVAPGSEAIIRLGFSQRGVVYELCNADTGLPVKPDDTPVEGTGGVLELPTPPIEDDLSYRIRAVKVEGADQPEARRAAWLRGSVRIQEGVDPRLKAQLLHLPVLDPRIDLPKLGDPRIAAYGSRVAVELFDSQEGVAYELIDHADPGEVLSQPVVGSSGNIRILSDPVTQDIDLRVRGRKEVGDPQHPEVRSAVLDAILPLRVRADPAASAELLPAIVDHGGSALLRLDKTRQGIDYRVWRRAIQDRDFVFEPSPELKTIDLTDGERIIRIRRPLQPPSWQDPPGFEPVGEATPGTGGALDIALGAFQQDTLLLVQATKQHRAGRLDGSSETLPSAVQLDHALALLVRPDRDRVIRLQTSVVDASSQGPWQVFAGQAGVYYRLRHAEALIARPAYFHQRDDLDPGLNKGIDQLRVEVDLALARDPSGPDPTGDRAGRPPPVPALDIEPLALGSVVQVSARKAMSGLEVALTESATLHPVPDIRVEPASVEPGGTASIVIEASVVGERYWLLRDGAPLGNAFDGNGDRLELDTGPLGEGTLFEVAMERTTDPGLPVERRVAVRVVVEAPADDGG